MKWFNNKILIIILGLLATAFVLTKVFRTPGLESNLDPDLLKIDTTGLTEIRLYPISEQRMEVKLMRNENRWSVARDSIKSGVEAYAINSLMEKMTKLKPERIVTRKKEKWNDYSVGDTTGTEVVATKNKNEVARLMIGRESGNQTYVRLVGEDEVYSVQDLNRSTFDRSFNDWRDKSFLRVEKSLVTKIRFGYPADSAFIVEKSDKIWMIGNEKADSAKIENYLNSLRSKDLSVFADDFTPATNPDVTVTIESGSIALATVKAWKVSFYKWIMTSDRQPGVYFSDEAMLVAKDLFPRKKELLLKELIVK